MNTTRMISAAVLMVATGLTLQALHAQEAAGTKRTGLQRHDLSIPGRQAVQAVVAFAPGLATYVVEKGKPLLTPAK